MCCSDCKVVLATLRIELTRIQDGGYTPRWTRLHPDYLCHIEVSRHDAYLELCKGVMRVQGGL